MLRFLYLLLALVILPFASALAEIYQWTDAQGQTHFGDRPPASSKAKKVQIEINSYESVTIEPFEPFRSNRASRAQVIMYSTAWCGVCKRAKRYFQKHNIAFQEFDVETSVKGREDYQQMNGRGVPIILVGNKRMNGFSVRRFQTFYSK